MLPSAKFVLPVLAAALLAGCSSGDAAAPTEIPSIPAASLTVTVEPAQAGPLTTTMSATGNVTARQMVLVSTEVSGLTIQRVQAAEGDLVKKDQILAQLGTDQLQTQIEQQVAANRGLGASLNVAQLALDRGQQLSANGNLSASEQQSRQSALDSAKSTLEQGEAALKSLRLQLAEATILAPVNGRLATASPSVGQLAQTGTTLFSIIEDDDLEVQAAVPEQLLGRIVERQGVVVAGSDGTGVVGTVRAIAQQVDPTTRLGIVYVTLPDASGFRIGMSAQVTFETALANVLTVPETALAWRDGATGVFVVDEGEKVHFTKVEAGDHQDGRVVIIDGLATGRDVAIDGIGFLNEGMQVRVAQGVEAEVGK